MASPASSRWGSSTATRRARPGCARTSTWCTAARASSSWAAASAPCWCQAAERSRLDRTSEVDDGARERAGDAVDHLDAAHDHLAQLVHRAGLGTGDDVVGTGDVFRGDDTVDV